MEPLRNMKTLWKQPDDTLESTASVVDGHLILSLPDAINPIVWKMELGSVKSSALEVRKTPDNSFLLLLKTAKGDVHDIAPFEEKEKAVKALMAVSHALKNAQGQMVATGTQNAASFKTDKNMPHGDFLTPNKEVLKWVFAFIGVLVVIFLFAYMAKNAPYTPPSQDTALENSATSVDGTPTGESGVPQSADDMLRGF